MRLLRDPQAALDHIGRNHVEPAVPAPADYATPLAVELSHGDPFDEMLLIHAQRFGAKLLTCDRLLLGHPLVVQP